MFNKPGCCAQAFFVCGVFIASVGELRRDGCVASQAGRSRQDRALRDGISGRRGTGAGSLLTVFRNE